MGSNGTGGTWLRRLGGRGVRASASSEQGPNVPGRGGKLEGYVCTYDTLDDYGTIFQRGCFNEWLAERFPGVLVA